MILIQLSKTNRKIVSADGEKIERERNGILVSSLESKAWKIQTQESTKSHLRELETFLLILTSKCEAVGHDLKFPYQLSKNNLFPFICKMVP
ncbi:hypothetical protein C5167_039112, partial [Papaver somniferum]